MHDQRVGGWNIEAGLDDGGREQDVVFAVIERRHDVLDDGRRHLAMRDRELHLRHVLVEEVFYPCEIFDTGRDIERLSAPITFAQQDRKSTRLNSSHLVISYAVFCLKKKKTYAS